MFVRGAVEGDSAGPDQLNVGSQLFCSRRSRDPHSLWGLSIVTVIAMCRVHFMTRYAGEVNDTTLSRGFPFLRVHQL
ncbi:hypothetical protein J6590_009379 [Homalodisca vitripennis]|nr:hypothetical protein J6590_009379 [Homalodisca vitripennis]